MCRTRKKFSGRQFEKEGVPALQLWDCVLESFWHSDAEWNFARPSGNRHLLCHSHQWLTTFQATFPRVEDNEAVIRMIMMVVGPI